MNSETSYFGSLQGERDHEKVNGRQNMDNCQVNQIDMQFEK
jgi:hypothetical protein